MIKPVLCICENKGADQLHSNRAADKSLCFGFIVSKDSKIPLFPNLKFHAFNRALFLYSPVCVRPVRKR